MVGNGQVYEKKTKDGEPYILVVQDVFSRFLWTEASPSKVPQAVAKACGMILAKAGTEPRSVTTGQGPEFSGPFAEVLVAKGIASTQKV